MNGARIKIEANALGKNNPEFWLTPIEPTNEEDIKAINEGLTNPINHRWMGLSSTSTLSANKAWAEKVAASENLEIVNWGIRLEGKLVGMTDLRLKHKQFAHRSSSGKVVFERSLDGKGIGFLISLARAMYAIDYLDLKVLVAQVFLPNIASWRSMWHAGYVPVGIKRQHYHLGNQNYPTLELEMYLPSSGIKAVNAVFSDAIKEELIGQLSSYGLGEAATAKFLELSQPRPEYGQELDALLSEARKVMHYE